MQWLKILPFLFDWIRLSTYDKNYKYSQPIVYEGNIVHQPEVTHWSLLHELNDLPNDEIERFLPQVCNIALDRDDLKDDHLSDYFERIIVNKCSSCFPFGLRVCGLLKVSHSCDGKSDR